MVNIFWIYFVSNIKLHQVAAFITTYADHSKVTVWDEACLIVKIKFELLFWNYCLLNSLLNSLHY